MLSEHRDMAAAQAFFRLAKAATGVAPERVTTNAPWLLPAGDSLDARPARRAPDQRIQQQLIEAGPSGCHRANAMDARFQELRHGRAFRSRLRRTPPIPSPSYPPHPMCPSPPLSAAPPPSCHDCARHCRWLRRRGAPSTSCRQGRWLPKLDTPASARFSTTSADATQPPSVTMRFGLYFRPASNRLKKRLSTVVFRRSCTRMSRTTPC